MPTLIISEKNKAALAIAEALGPVTQIKKSKFLRVYYVPSEDVYVVPLRGHVLEHKNTDAFKSWTKSNPRDIITDPKAIKKYPMSYSGPYIKALKEYSKICDQCIIGTDADIEGCNIGLYDALPYVKQVKPNIKVKQIWLSSLQKAEIIQKFKNLIPPKYSWGATGEARAIIDAIIGFSATREVTNTLRPLLKRFNMKFTSIGRVQTSLLYLIYLLDDRTNKFVSEPYYTIEAKLYHEDGSFKARHQLNPFKKQDELKARNIFKKIKDEKIALIINNSTNSIKKRPPTPLSTSKALILLTRNLKISANHALNAMNALYLKKIISYPRTDSDVYKPNFNHLQYLEKFATHSLYGKYDQDLLKKNKISPTKGKKDAGDHPPITPIESIDLNNNLLENNIQRKVYDVLTRHYLALFGDDAIESKTMLKLEIKSEPFIARLVSLISEGFLEIAPFLKINYDSSLKIVGNQIPIEEMLFNERKTKPPPRYTDTTLLQLMERHNLGTKATRPKIIQLLQARSLISRNKRQYFITDFGTFLIENLKDIWLPFLEPQFTRDIEALLEDIKEKRKTKEEVVNAVKNRFLSLFDKFLANKNKIILKVDEFKKKNKNNFTSNKKFPQTHANCPFCNISPMKYVTTFQKKRFLACSNDKCDKKYLSLPKKGRIYILKSNCSICGFNVFKVNTRKDGRTFNYYICPACWNEGLKNKISKGFCPKCKNFKIVKDQCVKK